MLYRTLSVRELRNRTRFFAKRCPFISLLHKYPRARVVHVPCAKEGVQELDRPESVLARNGWWEIKAVGDGERRFRARAKEEETMVYCAGWNTVACGGGARIASVSDLTHTRNRASTSAHSLNIGRDVSVPAAIPSHFRFVTFRLSVRFGPRDQPSASSQKFVSWIYYMCTRSIFSSEDLNF